MKDQIKIHIPSRYVIPTIIGTLLDLYCWLVDLSLQSYYFLIPLFLTMSKPHGIFYECQICIFWIGILEWVPDGVQECSKCSKIYFVRIYSCNSFF